MDTSQKKSWEKETRYKKTIWFHLHEIQKQAKLIYGDWEKLLTKEPTGVLEIFLYLDLGGYMGSHI